jgi:apolipoprotein N-acyltransferase
MIGVSCLFSAGLLVCSFPQIEWNLLAWIALVPLFYVLEGQRMWPAFRRAYLCGFVFFAFTLGWFVYVTFAGAFLLIAFLSLYFALFGMAFVFFQERLKLIPRLFVLASVWTVLEFTRAHLFSGFGWVTLGHSQYRNLWLIQIADITGVYGVSFVVMLVNLLVFEMARRYFKRDCSAAPAMTRASILVMAILFFVMGYGFWVLAQKHDYPTIKIGLVQPNIPLAASWDESQWPAIIAKDIELSTRLKSSDLDLIIWPETTLPGVINDSPLLTKQIQDTAINLKTPLLLGSIAQEGDAYYNAAFLIGADGNMQGRYDKIHLVPFGEYLPLRPILSWVTKIVPIDDFTFGKTYKIFSLPQQKNFGVLICFEDTLGYLRRNFANAGADLFVNITNDAWFSDTKAPFLHLQAAVLGVVENHRSLARAANTGVSALVDPWGRILAMAQDGRGKKTFINGVASGALPLNHEKTFYTKYGFYLPLFFVYIMGNAVKTQRSAVCPRRFYWWMMIRECI